MPPDQLRALFVAQANALRTYYMQSQVYNMSSSNTAVLDARSTRSLVGAYDYVYKANWLADLLGVDGADGETKPSPNQCRCRAPSTPCERC